jgi:hypothetical protein
MLSIIVRRLVGLSFIISILAALGTNAYAQEPDTQAKAPTQVSWGQIVTVGTVVSNHRPFIMKDTSAGKVYFGAMRSEFTPRNGLSYRWMPSNTSEVMQGAWYRMDIGQYATYPHETALKMEGFNASNGIADFQASVPMNSVSPQDPPMFNGEYYRISRQGNGLRIETLNEGHGFTRLFAVFRRGHEVSTSLFGNGQWTESLEFNAPSGFDTPDTEVLFIAFGEENGSLPDRSGLELKGVFVKNVPSGQQPVIYRVYLTYVAHEVCYQMWCYDPMRGSEMSTQTVQAY